MKYQSTVADLDLQKKFRRLAKLLMLSVILVATVGFAGWEFDIRIIRHPLPHMIAMNPLSSFCFALAGLSFFLLRSGAANGLRNGAGIGLALTVAFFGVLRIGEIASNQNFHIDQLFYYNEFQKEAAVNLANHIALNTAFTLMLLGGCLVISNQQSSAACRVYDLAACIILVLGMLALVGAFYGVHQYNSLLSFIPISVPTAIAMVLCGMALIIDHPDQSIFGITFRASYGGTIARVLVPAAVVLPILMGYLRLLVQWKFPVTIELGTSYMIIGIIIVFLCLVMFTSILIERKDHERKNAEDELRENNLRLERMVLERTAELSRNERLFRALIENSADAIVLTDQNVKVHFQSPGAERMTGISLRHRQENPGISYTHPDETARIQASIRQSIENPGLPIGFQSRFLHRNRYYIWIEGVMTNLLNDPDVKSIAFNYRDVTARKMLEERQNLYRAMVDSSNDAIISMNLTGEITTWNQGAQRLFGYTEDEAIGKTALLIIPLHLQGEEEDILSKVRVGESVQNYETERITREGKIVFISLSVSPIMDDSGKIIGASKIAHDITERREVQKKLSSSEKRFRALIENISDAIVLNDADFNVIYQSSSVTRILGYTYEDRIGKPTINYIHPDHRSEIRILNDELKNNPWRPFPFQYRFLHKDGHYVWLEGFITNLLYDPNVNAYVTNYRDITERKEAEEKLSASETRFRSLIESSTDGIAMLNAESEIIYRSPAAYRIGGKRGMESTKDPLLSTHPDDRPYMTARYQEVIAKPAIPVAFTGRFQHADGHYFWLEGTVTNLLKVEGVNAIVVNFHDITERKAAEEEIIKLNSGLEATVAQRTSQLLSVNKELEAFTYSVSHDLRAPLRIINGFSQILLEDYQEKLDAAGQKTLGSIMRNARRMGSLIDDLLEFSRVGRKEIRAAGISMEEIVNDIVADMRANNTAGTAAITVHPLAPALGDLSLIRQVWVNLISNAIKYSSRNQSPVVEIGMMNEDGIEYYFIKDNGAGFDMQYAGKLFGVFQRLHKAEDFEGTGVGLALVKRIVDRHGGAIKAVSEVGKGATFYFCLGDPADVTRDKGEKLPLEENSDVQ